MNAMQPTLPKPKPQYAHCQYKDHWMADGDGYVWSDPDHGVPDAIQICRECFAEAILKFYPDGKLAAHIRLHPEEYKRRPA